MASMPALYYVVAVGGARSLEYSRPQCLVKSSFSHRRDQRCKVTQSRASALFTPARTSHARYEALVVNNSAERYSTAGRGEGNGVSQPIYPPPHPQKRCHSFSVAR